MICRACRQIEAICSLNGSATKQQASICKDMRNINAGSYLVIALQNC